RRLSRPQTLGAALARGKSCGKDHRARPEPLLEARDTSARWEPKRMQRAHLAGALRTVASVRHLGLNGSLAPGNLPCSPQPVMLAGPIGIDLTARHGQEGALDVKRAQIDMDDDGAGEPERGRTMDHPRVVDRWLTISFDRQRGRKAEGGTNRV